jgi:hypothetical protein
MVKMSIENLLPRKMRLAATGVAIFSTLASAHLPNLYNALTAKGLVAAQNKTVNVNGTDVTADIYLTEFSNNIMYPLVVIDEVLNQTEKSAVEAIRGKYIVAADDSSKADSLYSLIHPTAVAENTANSSMKLNLNGNSSVSADIYNLSGRKLTTLYDGMMQKGEHELDLRKSGLPAGTYICRFRPGNNNNNTKNIKDIKYTKSKKFSLMR